MSVGRPSRKQGYEYRYERTTFAVGRYTRWQRRRPRTDRTSAPIGRACLATAASEQRFVRQGRTRQLSGRPPRRRGINDAHLLLSLAFLPLFLVLAPGQGHAYRVLPGVATHRRYQRSFPPLSLSLVSTTVKLIAIKGRRLNLEKGGAVPFAMPPPFFQLPRKTFLAGLAAVYATYMTFVPKPRVAEKKAILTMRLQQPSKSIDLVISNFFIPNNELNKFNY